MDKAKQILELINEKAVLTEKLAKMVKFDINKNWRLSVTGAIPTITAYCECKFLGYEIPEKRIKMYKIYILEHQDGKKVSLFTHGRKVYDGTISYLKKWNKARHALSLNARRLRGLGFED